MKTKQTALSDTTITCTVCGETSAIPWRVGVDHLLGGTHRYRAVKCLRCATRRLDPRPDAETMAQYYQPETYARAEEEGSEVGKRLDAYAARLAEVSSSSAPVGKVRSALDIGCGDGRFMAALQKRGWQVTGTETDPAAAKLARRRTDATVFESAMPPTRSEAKAYDLVSLLHVLEHVSDPRETLRDVRERLLPGGELLLVLPNADSIEAGLFGTSWYHLDLPRHLWSFTPASLVRLVETTGFEVTVVRYTPFLFAPQSLLRVFGKANGAIPGRHVQGIGRSQSGGAWQTRVFNALLRTSNRLGRNIPGEIIELTARVSEGKA
ncbi:MAG: class I SAM-dependent methyltransferase [Akkermansiaceae bacterium]|nr:class I SAM-dependent methyltransferase [Armatimonadota bacterium]